MAYIYKITNQINGKAYIGKTLLTIEQRWKQHISDSFKKRCEKRPLYDAINKYGVENFTIEIIENCSPECINDRERYWIEHFKTFKYGYNATKGGDGKAYIDYQLVISVYNETQNINRTAEIVGCSTDSIHTILINNNINIKSSTEVMKDLYGKNCGMFSKTTGELLKTFISLREAGNYLIENGITTSFDLKGVAARIGQVCNNKRKTAYGYIWKYI